VRKEEGSGESNGKKGYLGPLNAQGRKKSWPGKRENVPGREK